MTAGKLKAGYFVLTAISTIATSWFFNYLFFYLRDRFQFDNRENLWMSALYGFIYVFSAWQCGKFAQRRGFITSLKVGFVGLALTMVAGALVHGAPWMIAVLVVYSVVLLFTWPALEALVSENETPAGIQHMVGVYNITWAAAAALANFTGGGLYDWSPKAAVFWIPAGLFVAQLLFVIWLAPRARHVIAQVPEPAGPHRPEAAAFRQPVSPQTFLKMAWLANPLAYVAVNTLLAVMPGIATKHGLTTTQAGWFGAIWFFARFVAFLVLWQWNGWHYRFRWLLAAFVMLIVSFASILLAPELRVVAVAEVFFGFAAALIYYSSLFYSMDVGDTKAEHGGLHEAAIGAGIFVGPAVGAAALQFLPHQANAGAYAVSGLLTCGLVALLWMRVRR